MSVTIDGRGRLSLALRERARLGVQAGEVGRLVVGVEPARVREDPDRAAGEIFVLQADDGVAAAERGAVGGEADDRDQAWPVLADDALELPRARAQLGVGQLGGRARRPRSDVRDADAVREQLGVLVRAQAPQREARRVQRRPETVARSREVVAGLRGVQRRVDADEQDLKARPDDRAELAQPASSISSSFS